MKKQMKKIVAVLLMLTLSFSLFTVLVHAEGPAKSKYYANVQTTAAVYSGVLGISNHYMVTGEGFTSAEIHTYVERRVLGIFWFKVDNGQSDNTWIALTNLKNYTKTYSLTLPQTGTYRVTVEYTFYGSYGSESLTKQHTVTY